MRTCNPGLLGGKSNQQIPSALSLVRGRGHGVNEANLFTHLSQTLVAGITEVAWSRRHITQKWEHHPWIPPPALPTQKWTFYQQRGVSFQPSAKARPSSLKYVHFERSQGRGEGLHKSGSVPYPGSPGQSKAGCGLPWDSRGFSRTQAISILLAARQRK